MRRRYTATELHPSVFEAIQNLTQQTMSGVPLSDVKAQSALGKHSSIWFKEYWRGFALWLSGLIPVIASAPLAREHLGKGPAAMFLFAGLALWGAGGLLGYQRNRRAITHEELEAIRPALALSEAQQLYLDCVIAVLSSTILNAAQKDTWLVSLKDALSNAMQLEILAEEMKDSVGGRNHSELLKEATDLRGKVEGTNDPHAKEAYEQSLQMVDERLSRSDGMAVQAERMEAQLELTRQTFLKTKELIKGMALGTRQSIHVDLDPLRANLSRVQTESQMILKAIEELNQT